MNRRHGMMIGLAAAAAAVVVAGCASLQTDEADAAVLIKEFSPVDEYYIGRSVAATVLAQYKPSNDVALNEYVNMVGQVVAMASGRPEIFGGYHFVVLESDEVTAFAAPGGFVMVTKGLLKCCRSEDALAAVLAHEIAHIELRHGLYAVKQARMKRAFARNQMTDTMLIHGTRNVQQLNAQQFNLQMATMLGNTTFDITRKMIRSGYSRKAEEAADRSAVEILRKAGYDERAILDIFAVMKVKLSGDQRGFAMTHPAPVDRMEYVKPLVSADAGKSAPKARQDRFDEAVRGI
ncbi:MAG: peptidase M48 [Verrucomicrobia bacterium]|nr:peptidase M48 [Verrucomicrobiota bacterium]